MSIFISYRNVYQLKNTFNGTKYIDFIVAVEINFFQCLYNKDSSELTESR